MSPADAAAKTVPCRACRQPIDAQASKCQHCGELQVKPFSLERQIKRVVGWIGFFTAFLSLFYVFKEGYYTIEQRQQRRAAFNAHLHVAERFLKLDNLEYAEASLNQALQINPNDLQLRLKYFQLRAHNLLRDADYYGAQLPTEKLTVIPELVTDGFSLLETQLPTTERAQLLVWLGRLLQYDQHWQSPQAITELFRQARQLAPENAEVGFWFGEWLLDQDPPDHAGRKLIEQAVAQEPDNPLYLYSLGRYQRQQGEYRAAFASFRRAIAAGDQQLDLQQQRAVNEAKYAQRRTLLEAAAKQAITGDFYGISLENRLELLDDLLAQPGSDRGLQLLAAQLFHHVGRDAEAEAVLKERLGRYDSRSNADELELLAEILTAQGKAGEAAGVRTLLAEQRERASYEEVLETSINDGHRYKVGLRVAKQSAGPGVEVLKVYSGYPFAKAGVLPGDRLLEFAHRQVVDLRSIWVPINDFSPGTDVPLRVLRDGQQLDLTLLIE